MTLNLFKEYQKVLQEEVEYYYPSCMYNIEGFLQQGIDKLLECYSVNGLLKADSLNFNHIELRCAYMYLYSTSHSHMVLDVLSRYHQVGCFELRDLMQAVAIHQGVFNITSLGGGPGSDPLGIMVFLSRFGLLENFPSISVTVIDEFEEWERPFKSLMNKFHSSYSSLDFKAQDLLQTLSPEVERSIQEASFLSMVKFISAIHGNGRETVNTLSRIFSLLRPGSLILIIDNAGGQAFQDALNVAYATGMVPVFGPFLHVKFQIPRHLEPKLNTVRFGKHTQTTSIISMAILKKVPTWAPPIVNSDIMFGYLSRGPEYASAPAIRSSSTIWDGFRAFLNLRIGGN